MRLPGTMNWPTQTKLAKGRVAVAARLIEQHPDRVYTLADFGNVPVVMATAPIKDVSRSSDLLRKVSVAVAAGRADDMIVAQLVDHPHAADQTDPTRAVRRCIEKVRADVDAALLDMNGKHAVVCWKGKTIVLTEKVDPHFGRKRHAEAVLTVTP